MKRWKNPFKRGFGLPNISGDKKRVMETLDYPSEEKSDKVDKVLNRLILFSLLLMAALLILLRSLGVRISLS